MYKLLYAINLILLFLIARYEYNSGSDKTIILSSLAFAVLVVLNLMLGFFAQIDNKPIFRHYYYSALGLVICGLVLFYNWVTFS